MSRTPHHQQSRGSVIHSHAGGASPSPTGTGGASLPPLVPSARSAAPATPAPAAAGDVGRAYDFEVRSGGGVSGSRSGPLAPVKGWRTLASQPVSDSAAHVRRHPGAAIDATHAATGGLAHSASAHTLPSHLHSTSDKIEFFLNWNKGWGDNDADGSSSSATTAAQQIVSGVLTPRTRYDRLAQSVAAVPFASDEAKERDGRIAPLNLGPRTLGSSASSPALLGRNYSHSSLHGPPASSNTRGGAAPPSLFMPPSEFLARLMPESLGVSYAVAAENARAALLAERFQTLLGARKARKKNRKRAMADGKPTNDMDSVSSDSSSDELDDGVAPAHDTAAAGGAKRKPGTQHGAALLHQIQSIVRTVTEEKEAALGLTGPAVKRRGGGGGDSDDEAPRAAAAKDTSKAAMTADDVRLQSVIQAYMETTGLVGTVAAGGASSTGGGTILARDGSSTFTTAKITRDVRLVLDSFKTNPVLRADLFARIAARTAEKKAQDASRMAASGVLVRSQLPLNRVAANTAAAWSHTESAREAARAEVAKRERARIQRARENKAAIDAIWLARSRERDLEVLRNCGPEMLARRARENAEAERVAHVAWGWIMFTRLIPRTQHLRWRLREIVQARITAQTAAFLVPAVRRSYVLNVTFRLTETRALALEKIKRVMVRYVRRWKWRKRRAACLHVWRLLALAKNARAIRHGLKDSSLRAQIVKLQTWWRGILLIVSCQQSLVERAWNRRETALIKNWAKKQKKAAAAAAANNALTRKPGPQRGMSTGHARGMSDFASTLGSSLNPRAAQLERDTPQGLAPKRVPRAQKREVIERYVKRRRVAFRIAMRAHAIELQAWTDEHAHEIELRNARSELGLRIGSFADASGVGSGASRGVLETLVPPSRPRLHLLPSGSDLENMILSANKQYVLSKLRGAMIEDSARGLDAPAPPQNGFAVGSARHRDTADHHKHPRLQDTPEEDA